MDDSLHGDDDDTAAVHGFLVSDLGAPLPLHISLSPPFVLRAPEKDGYLDRLVDDVRTSRVAP